MTSNSRQRAKGTRARARMTAQDWTLQAMRRQSTFLRKRLLPAILNRPELCGPDHDAWAYQVARGCAHAALQAHPELRPPGEGMRY